MKIDYYRLTMVRSNLRSIPRFALPGDFQLRFFRAEEAKDWARVETAAGEFPSEEAALQRFHEEFGSHTDEMERRCVVLTTREDRMIGTATAWFNPNFCGNEYGRLHWVSIVPEYQGKGLAKPLVSHTLQVLARLHTRGYLTSQTTSYRAIMIYLDFGFEPLYQTETCRLGWELLRQLLDHPKLASSSR